MPNLNPYECSKTIPTNVVRVRLDLTRHLIAALPGLTVVILAATKFSDAARTLDGAASGAILIVVASVVGRVLAGESARPLAIISASLLALVMCSGLADHERGERVLFAFSCICAGVLWGACAPLKREDQDDEVIDVEVLPSSVDETTLRS